jgi:protein TonB
MSTSILPWVRQVRVDSPWRRLHWTLPLALLICAITFIMFAYSMSRPVVRTSEPAPVTAEVVELPAPEQAQPRVLPQTIERPKLEPVEQPVEQPKLTLPVRQEQPGENVRPAAAPAPPEATVRVQNNPPAALSESHGAQALIQPLPIIPDELREEALNEVATARFQIAVDGNAAVELVKPTQNPRLNRLLLDTLKNWKFMPAMKEGKPVTSVEIMVIRLQVK